MVKKTYFRKRKRKQKQAESEMQPEEEIPQGLDVFVQLPRIDDNCAEAECDANAMDVTNAESSQHIQQNVQLSGEAICTSVNSLVKNVPRRRTSKHKKGTDVGNSAKRPDVGNGAKRKTARPHREQICEEVVCLGKSVVTPQRSLRCRGQSRIRSSDLGELDSGTLSCYLEKIWAKIPEERRSLFTYLDSFWYYMYTNRNFKPKVLNWIKSKDISKTYVFVPIAQWGHWFLLIICNMGKGVQSKASTPCLLLLDSMQVAHAKQMEPGIRKFVFDSYGAGQTKEVQQMIRKIPFRIPKVPQQKDNKECGYYVLYYISRFLELAPEEFSLSDGYPYFMKKDWFTPEELDNFCNELKSSPPRGDSPSPKPDESSSDSGSIDLQDCCIS
ncbi:probable ubiquitin-like-specific protease 2A isoform X2 [Ipomoea triloba]|uniref:probable ubiquitin-like-specific protease 2A isoform X2 n=1 Tax=Ipomoea triloba TaxID=35885 RepID=UPI00125D2E44|nr:probable ubiquitin-like-specific protease 2A isoform X2 [Ipomoea triloba]